MKICYLGNVTSPITRNLALHFASKNEVHFITFDQALISNVHVHCMGHHSYNSLSKIACLILNFSKVKRLIYQLKPDILHAHIITSYGVVAAWIGYQPLVVSAMGSDVLYLAERYWLYRRVTQWVLDRAQVVTASAEVMAEALVKLGVSREKIVTHYYGIDIARFNTEVRCGKKKSKTIILCTRYFEKPQNVADFIKAIPWALKHLSEESVEFWVIGTGSEEKRIRALSKKLILDGVIRFLGEIPHETMPYYFGLADVYVSPSISDTNHVSLTEAMACGVFPVVTDIPANRSWIVNGVNGLLVPVGNPEALGMKIAEAIERKDLREDAIAKNLDIIRSRALWEDNIKKLEGLYEKLIHDQKNE